LRDLGWAKGGDADAWDYRSRKKVLVNSYI